MRCSADGSSARSSSGRSVSRSSFNNNTYFDPACGDPKDLKATVGQGRRRRVPRRRCAGHRPRRVSTRSRTSRSGMRPDNRSRSRPPRLCSAQSNIRTFPTTLPDVRFMNHHLLDFGLTKNFRVGDRVRVQVQNRSAERDQLHAVRLGQRDAGEQQRDVHDAEQHRLEHGHEAARHSDRRARDVLNGSWGAWGSWVAWGMRRTRHSSCYVSSWLFEGFRKNG